jgi:hypothetical protein
MMEHDLCGVNDICEPCELSGFPPNQCGCRIHNPKADRERLAEERRRASHDGPAHSLPTYISSDWPRRRELSVNPNKDSHGDRTLAQFDSKCPVCGDYIYTGDKMIMLPEGWSHWPECDR